MKTMNTRDLPHVVEGEGEDLEVSCIISLGSLLALTLLKNKGRPRGTGRGRGGGRTNNKESTRESSSKDSNGEGSIPPDGELTPKKKKARIDDIENNMDEDLDNDQGVDAEADADAQAEDEVEPGAAVATEEPLTDDDYDGEIDEEGEAKVSKDGLLKGGMLCCYMSLIIEALNSLLFSLFCFFLLLTCFAFSYIPI